MDGWIEGREEGRKEICFLTQFIYSCLHFSTDSYFNDILGAVLVPIGKKGTIIIRNKAKLIKLIEGM